MVSHFSPTSSLAIKLIFVLLSDNIQFVCWSSCIPSIASDNSEYNLICLIFSLSKMSPFLLRSHLVQPTDLCMNFILLAVILLIFCFLIVHALRLVGLEFCKGIIECVFVPEMVSICYLLLPLLMSTSSKFSRAANLFDILLILLDFHIISFLRLNLSISSFCAAHLLTNSQSVTFQPPDNGQ